MRVRKCIICNRIIDVDNDVFVRVDDKCICSICLETLEDKVLDESDD